MSALLRFLDQTEVKIFLGWAVAIHLFELIFLPSMIIPAQILSNLTLTQRLLQVWTTNADTAHYMLIAKEGYASANPAFFPMLPIVLKIFGANPVSSKIISLLLALIFIIVLKKLIGLFKYSKYSQEITFYFLVFPASFLLVAPFSETLYLPLSALAIYFAEKRDFAKASIFMAFATATRMIGLVLVFYLFLKIIEKGVNQLAKWWWTLLVAPLGIILIGVYFQITRGNFLLFYSGHSGWGRSLGISNLEHLILESKELVLQIFGPVKPVSINLIHFGAIFFFIFLAAIAFKKISKPLWIYCLLTIIVPLMSGTYSGTPRYLLAAFPLFIPLAKYLENRKALMYVYIFLTIFIQAIFLIRFFNFEVAT